MDLEDRNSVFKNHNDEAEILNYVVFTSDKKF